MRIQRFSSAGTLAVVCLATAMLMLDIAVVNTALPKIAADLRSGLTGIQWVVDAYTLALAAVVLTAGSIADRTGRRLIFTSGMALFTVTSLACAVASDIAVLDAARALQGIGAATMFASSLAILVDAFPTEPGRAKAFAAYGGTIGAAFAVDRSSEARSRAGSAGGPFSTSTSRSASPHSPRATDGCASRETPRPDRSTGSARRPLRAGCSFSCWPCCAAIRKVGAARASSPS